MTEESSGGRVGGLEPELSCRRARSGAVERDRPAGLCELLGVRVRGRGERFRGRPRSSSRSERGGVWRGRAGLAAGVNSRGGRLGESTSSTPGRKRAEYGGRYSSIIFDGGG